jgi:hypothetical protein
MYATVKTADADDVQRRPWEETMQMPAQWEETVRNLLRYTIP